ncbi:glycosyltransferase family A protein [Flavobacterium phragmitis]|uniref:Glycosyl transferase family 2 n=1 Tax=Flavobacterium phragmitis TaxID=739143 RepID=A0A1I1UVG1_9FLAO|nr:glycosyltransferase family A protein [Flavobacterium phragmitis]SFD73668.1 hypothetical protein SAMN05216297_111159 [Flavobacterium phragmitis]
MKDINNKPRITFGMIVLNGEPFISYNLRSLYPFAHEIIVVEGACPSASKVATEKGHSLDGTLEALHEFKRKEDPDNKLLIITAESLGNEDGFWNEKSEMSQAYANRATGNYLWQIDSDEFYRAEDMDKVIDFLVKNPTVTEVSFRTKTFWGGLNYNVDGILLKLGDQDFHRLFAWGEGYKYVTHRPPTVNNKEGVNLLNIHSVKAQEMMKLGVFMYHYEYLFPHQVRNKAEYYSNAPHCKGLRPESSWAEECYMKLGKPYRVHNIYKWISWLEKYKGKHPQQVVNLIEDIKKGNRKIELRNTEDIEILLKNYWYKLGKLYFKGVFPIYKLTENAKLKIRDLLLDTFLWVYIQKIRGKQL